MQTRLKSDRPPLSAEEAVFIGTGRLYGSLTGDGCRWNLLAAHCQLPDVHPALSIELEAGACDNWSGELNAEMAIFTEKFTADGVSFVRETIAHFEMDLLIVRLMASHPFNATVQLSGPTKALASNERIVLAGTAGDQRYTAETRIHLGGGEMATEGDQTFIRDAYELVVELNIGVGTSAGAAAECGRHRIAAVEGWDQLMQKHVDAWRQHFGGLTGTVTGSDNPEPLPARRDNYGSGKADPRLAFSYLQICRYLLCSRHGSTTTAATTENETIDSTGVWASLHTTSLSGYFSSFATEIGEILHGRAQTDDCLAAAVIASFIGDDIVAGEQLAADRQALHDTLLTKLKSEATADDTALIAIALLDGTTVPPSRELSIAPCALPVYDRLPTLWKSAIGNAKVNAKTAAAACAAKAWQQALQHDADGADTALKELLVSHTGGYLAPMANDQIDLAAAGLSGGAIIALLIQPDADGITLLPALPSAWPQGAIHGLRVRGGLSVSLEWSLGRLTKAVVAGSRGGPCTLRNLPDVYKLMDDHENEVPFTQENGTISFQLTPMQAYFLERKEISLD